MSSNDKEILVFADWQGLNGPLLMGRLFASRLRGKEVFQFEYEPEWLKKESVLHIDPELAYYTGRQFPSSGRNIFGVFLDSMPDRWGRQLMLRREALMARKEGREARQLFESDYLLGVYDLQRQGGLRFKLVGDDRFLNDDKALAVPPMSLLRDLEHASMEIENSDDLDDNIASKWLNMLMAPGSSLGGARPKAGVKDKEGHLWIAKFPGKNDDTDVGAWEMIASELGRQSGLNMATSKVIRLSSKHHTYLSRRFDRTSSGNRLHFASAMTLLQYNDGDDFTSGASYLELADFIIRHGAQPEKDLEELWRRIVFFVCIKNTDDHLRNHGFILHNDGWRLSPAYDVNPNPKGTGLRLNISENDNALDLELARSISPFFRVTPAKANEIIHRVNETVASWQAIANRYQVSKFDHNMMMPAFCIS